VRNSTELNLQITCTNLQFETELKVAKKFKTRFSNPNPIQIRLSRIYKIHHKAENPQDLNPTPFSSLIKRDQEKAKQIDLKSRKKNNFVCDIAIPLSQRNI